MNSILQAEKDCYYCHTTQDIHKHHIYRGANRKISEQNGFWVWLCAKHHNMSNHSVHHNHELELELQRQCQTEYELTHTRQSFMALIGRNYLEV